MSFCASYRKRLNQVKEKKAFVKARMRQLVDSLDEGLEQATDLEKARVVIQTVATSLQAQLEYRISSLATMALKNMFEEPYDVKLKFVPKRGGAEADIYFVRDGHIVSPMDASEYGVVDMVCLALRISLWSLKNPRTRPIFIFDEPFKNLSKNYHEAAGHVLKEITHNQKTPIQIIMTTHENCFIESADRVFTVTQKKGVSSISISN